MRFKIEKNRSAAAVCTKNTHCAAWDQYGSSILLFFHHSRVSIVLSDDDTRAEALARYVGSSSFKCSKIVADRNGRILSWSISASVG